MKNNISENFLIRLLVLIILFCILIRCIAIINSPLELSPDEAQYWLWSQNLSWGYFSKPPLIAWLINLSNLIFGDSDFAVRVFSPILHGITALVIFYLSREIVSDRVANFLSSLIWLTLPIVGVGSFLMSTDSPLMLLWTVSLLLIVKAYKAENKTKWVIAGLVSGIGVYAKYAAIYQPLGLIIFFLIKINKNSKINLSHLTLFILSFVIISIPNIVWNIFNNFHTINHLSSNAVIDSPSYSILGSVIFLLSQIIVMGPIIFFIFCISLLNFKNFNNIFGLILYFVLPVFFVMVFQGFFSEANANWAATALPGISIICGYYLSKRMSITFIALITNSIICLVVFIISFTGELIFFDLKSDPLRKLRGWQYLSKDIVNIIDEQKTNLILVDRRGVAAELIYYLRSENIRIRVPKSSNTPSNHYQLNYSINEKESKKFYYLTEANTLPNYMIKNYEVSKAGISKTQISKNRYRILYFYYFKKIS
tara:strand:+ start:49 stop:1494 length:1446 start_codon:yes stop_codon:yes gene_type:complete